LRTAFAISAIMSKSDPPRDAPVSRKSIKAEKADPLAGRYFVFSASRIAAQ
jgi:hypothetical protein